jgi:hypothetical protein
MYAPVPPLELPPLLELLLLLELLPLLLELPPLELLLLELPLLELLLLPVVPVPDSATLSAAAPPPAVTFKVALLAPLEVGSNATLMEQAVPAATDVPQLLVSGNWVAALPLNAMLVIGTGELPVLVRAIVWAALTTASA